MVAIELVRHVVEPRRDRVDSLPLAATSRPRTGEANPYPSVCVSVGNSAVLLRDASPRRRPGTRCAGTGVRRGLAAAECAAAARRCPSACRARSRDPIRRRESDVSWKSACASMPWSMLSARDVLDDRELGVAAPPDVRSGNRAANSAKRLLELLVVIGARKTIVADVVAEVGDLARRASDASAAKHRSRAHVRGAGPGYRPRTRSCRDAGRSRTVPRAPGCARHAPG